MATSYAGAIIRLRTSASAPQGQCLQDACRTGRLAAMPYSILDSSAAQAAGPIVHAIRPMAAAVIHRATVMLLRCLTMRDLPMPFVCALVEQAIAFFRVGADGSDLCRETQQRVATVRRQLIARHRAAILAA